MTTRFTLSALAALSLASGTAFASDHFWREQIQLDLVAGPGSVIRITDESRARSNSLWREQVEPSTYLAGSHDGVVVFTGERSNDLWLWREQVELGADGSVEIIRISGSAEGSGTTRE